MEKQGLNLLLNRHLANCLVQSVQEAKDHFKNNDLWDLDQVFSSKTIRDFDDRFTSRQFGYAGYKEYYEHARLAGKLDRIKVPTLALNALDDPFQPGDSIPLDEAVATKNVAILTTHHGKNQGNHKTIMPFFKSSCPLQADILDLWKAGFRQDITFLIVSSNNMPAVFLDTRKHSPIWSRIMTT